MDARHVETAADPETLTAQLPSAPPAGWQRTDSGGGIVESLKGALGLGGGGNGVDQDRVDAAKKLTQAYADALQSHLESKNKWEQVRIAYQE